MIAAFGLLALAGPASGEKPSTVTLPIAARAQAGQAPAEGWCGETALQEALLHYGAFVPQRAINRAGKPSHPDLYWGDLPTAMRAMGLRFRAWSGRGGLSVFLSWTQAQLEADRPVLAGVKIYPTAHPAWGLDHIVLFTGIDSAAVRINTTWGHSLSRTRAQLDSTKAGMSLRNRARRQHAYAIDGIEETRYRTRLVLDEEGDSAVKATVTLEGLEPKRRYLLVRASHAGGAAEWSHDFVARGSTMSIPVRFARTRPSFFRVLAVAAP